jgi:hypothetical protein
MTDQSTINPIQRSPSADDGRLGWHWPSRDAARTYSLYAAAISALFVVLYGAPNWLADQRGTTFHLYLDAELACPFVPVMVWAYLSINILFLLPLFLLSTAALRVLGRQMIAAIILAGATFILLPTTVGFARPSAEHLGPVFEALYALDYPHNCVPSLHIAFSSQIILALASREALPARVALAIWFSVIAISTLLTHQHHLLDIGTGLLLTLATRLALPDGNVHFRTEGASSRGAAAAVGGKP